MEKTGELIWNVDCPQPILRAVLLTEELVLVPSGNHMLALERDSGRLVWDVTVGGMIAGQPAEIMKWFILGLVMIISMPWGFIQV